MNTANIPAGNVTRLCNIYCRQITHKDDEQLKILLFRLICYLILFAQTIFLLSYSFKSDANRLR